MLEYTQAGGGATLMMLVLHDDAQREYAYGPAQRLPDTKVGTFTQALYDEAKSKGWIVISMKNDWKRIFAWELARRDIRSPACPVFVLKTAQAPTSPGHPHSKVVNVCATTSGQFSDTVSAATFWASGFFV